MITREGLYATSDTLGEMGDAIEDFLTDAAIHNSASSAANKIVLHISDNLGGCQNYMPIECEDAPKATSFLHELTGVIAQALLTIHCFSAQPKSFPRKLQNTLEGSLKVTISIYLMARPETLSTEMPGYFPITNKG